MEGADRDRVVTEFRDGVTKILISTDVLSRGFDVSQVMVGRDGRRGMGRQGRPTVDSCCFDLGMRFWYT
jgi:RecG-like helicase